MEGLLSYHAKHGSILVLATFVIPSSNDNDNDDIVWPVATQGLPLGSIVQRIRLCRDFLSGDDGDDRRAILDKLGFVWDVGGYNFDKFVRALHFYDRLSSGLLRFSMAHLCNLNRQSISSLLVHFLFVILLCNKTKDASIYIVLNNSVLYIYL